jgi:hypothetical protein
MKTTNINPQRLARLATMQTMVADTIVSDHDAIHDNVGLLLAGIIFDHIARTGLMYSNRARAIELAQRAWEWAGCMDLA